MSIWILDRFYLSRNEYDIYISTRNTKTPIAQILTVARSCSGWAFHTILRSPDRPGRRSRRSYRLCKSRSCPCDVCLSVRPAGPVHLRRRNSASLRGHLHRNKMIISIDEVSFEVRFATWWKIVLFYLGELGFVSSLICSSICCYIEHAFSHVMQWDSVY